MGENKIAESTNSDALLHPHAQRVLLARRINEIALRMGDLRTELEPLYHTKRLASPGQRIML